MDRGEDEKRSEGVSQLLIKKISRNLVVIALVCLVCLNIHRKFLHINKGIGSITFNDYMKLLFIHTQTPNLDYIAEGDPLVYLGFFTVLMTGILFTTAHLKEVNQFHLIRYQLLDTFIKKAFMKSIGSSLSYIVMLWFTTVIVVYLLLPDFLGSLSSVNELVLISLYCCSLLLFYLTISKLMILLFIKTSRLLALYIVIIFAVAVLAIDVSIIGFNLLLYDYKYFFVDSILFWLCSLGILKLFQMKKTIKFNSFN